MPTMNIDLHCHLDGSLPLDFVATVLGKTPEGCLQQMQAPDHCQDLADYLRCFEVPVACMQSEKAVEEGSRAFVLALAKDNVAYAEARFSPVLFANETFSQRQALEATLQGLAQGAKETGIVVNTIVCGLRHFAPGVNEDTFRLARDYWGAGVCAVDLAGDEASRPNGQFVELFALAKALGLPFTIHGGECGSGQSVADAIALGASRIGHGIAMAGRPDLQKLCRDKGIAVELCPTSNFQTKAVQRPQDYPLAEFLHAGVAVTLNTDNRTVSNTTLEKEFALAQTLCPLTPEQIHSLRRNAILAAFASDDVKHSLLKRLG